MANDSDAGPSESEKRYCQAVIEELAILRFEGMSHSGKPICLPLEDVYVELAAVSEVPDVMDTYGVDERRLLAEAERRRLGEDDLRMHMDSLRLERWRDEGRAGRRMAERRSIEEAVADPGRPGLVILGDPGAGKSTLLHYLALRAARACMGTLPAENRLAAGLYTLTGQPRVPVLVPLAAYDDHLRREPARVSLAEFLPMYYERWRNMPGLGPLFAEALAQGRALILLDGLDEVLDTGTRRHAASQVQTLMQREAGRGNRFVITSRVIGYREAPLPADVPHVVVLDFGLDEIERFARQWCEACEVWLAGEHTEAVLQRAAREASALFAEVQAHPQVQALAANPLLLTMLALLRRQGGKLPDQRIELYRRYVDILLDNGWENARSKGARTAEPERFDQHWALDFLMELSLWLQQHRPSGTARQHELEEVLVGIGLGLEGIDPADASRKDKREARQRAAAFLEDMRHFTGLIGERGHDAFGFLHLTLQEYLAGRALARMDAAERWRVLAPNLHRPRWRESILLCAGQLGVVERRRRDASAFVRQVMFAGSPHEDILHRDLFLAAALAGDNVGLDRALSDDITDRLIALQESQVSRVRLAALHGLARLAYIGHERAVSLLHQRIVSRRDAAMTSIAVRDVLAAEPCASLRQVLCAWLKDRKDPEFTDAMHALAPLVSTDPGVRAALLEAARRAYPDATILTILPANDPDVRAMLMTAARDPDVLARATAMHCLSPLAAHDQEVREFLLAATRQADNIYRSVSIASIAPLAPRHAEIHDLLLEIARDSQARGRDAAIIALAPLAPSNSEIREFLLLLAMTGRYPTRTAAIEWLAPLASRFENVRSALLALARDGQKTARQSAFQALAKSASTLPIVHFLVRERLDSQAWDMRHEMLRALVPLVSHDAEIRTIVLSAAKAHSDPARYALIEALARQASQDAEVRAFLLQQANDPAEHVPEAFVEALTHLAHKYPEIRAFLLQSVEHKWIRERIQGHRAIVRAFARMAPHDPEARAALRSIVWDTDRLASGADATGLAALAPHDAEIRARLLTWINDDSKERQRIAIYGLVPLAAHDEAIRTLLLGKLDDADVEQRSAALDSLSDQIARHPEIDARLMEAARNAITDYAVDRNSKSLSLCLSAVEALGRLAAQFSDARACLLIHATSKDKPLRHGVIAALRGLVPGNGEVRALLLAATMDEDQGVRNAAITSLAPLASGDPEVFDRVILTTSDPSAAVRLAAISALAPAIPRHRGTWRRLLPWLGLDTRPYTQADKVRRSLAHVYAPLLVEDTALRGLVIEMLRSPAWPARQGAAWTLAAMPGGPPAEALPLLRDLIHDQRGEESWAERVQAAELVLNDRDVTLSRHAISVLMGALDYAIEPWYCFAHSGRDVRAQAAMALGTLRPLYRDEAIFARLVRLLAEDSDEEVRNAVYDALLRLAEAPEPTTAVADEEDTPAAHDSAVHGIAVSLRPDTSTHALPASTILHLSDLHLGTAESAAIWHSQLAEDLAELACTRLDAIILSGDIGNRSTADEYEAALLFIDKLCAELGVPRAHVILVPGNHDLSWPLAKRAYRLCRREDHDGPLLDGTYIAHSDAVIEVRDDDAHRRRFEPFARFYEAVRGEPYPLDYAAQGTLHHLPEHGLLVLGLNSAWDIDHHFKARASIHQPALTSTLDRIRQNPAYRDCPLKLAVWHHPITSASDDRIKDPAFLQQLAKAGFRLALHGHIHKAERQLFRYDITPEGRRIDIVSAGTFGAPVRQWVPGYPLQYNLLRIHGTTLTVDTRCREEPGGAWRPDARWLTGPGQNPLPRYTVELV